MSGELKVDTITSSANSGFVEIKDDLTVKGSLIVEGTVSEGNTDTVDQLHATDRAITTEGEEATLATKGAVKNFVEFYVPPGAIMIWSCDGVPAGWRECNGDWLPIGGYSRLYDAIGKTYGFNQESHQ